MDPLHAPSALTWHPGVSIILLIKDLFFKFSQVLNEII
jgi:hypothetical protein